MYLNAVFYTGKDSYFFDKNNKDEKFQSEENVPLFRLENTR